MATTGQPMQTEMPSTPTERRQSDLRAKFYQHLTVFLFVILGLFALNYTRNPTHLWSAWVAFGWGIGIVCHALKVFWFEADHK